MTYTLFKALVEARHLRGTNRFAREYDRVAALIDRCLVGTAPSQKQLERWMHGRIKTIPRAHHCLVLERMFPGHTVRELFGQYQPEKSTMAVVPADHSAPGTGVERREEIATDRRDALKVGGTVAAAYLVDSLLSEPDRLHAALDSGTVGEERLAELETTADDLATRLVRLPSVAPLLEPALTGFRTVRGLLARHQRNADRVRLSRVAARLGVLVGEVLMAEGHFHLVPQWARIGQRAALDAGDRYLADMALGFATQAPFYAGDPRGVLALVDPRLDGRLRPTQGVAFLWAAKARAHASLGEEIGFRHALNRATAALDNAPASPERASLLAFRPEKLAFYESTGHSRLGNVPATISAADRALGIWATNGVPALANRTMTRFDRATALARSGDLAEACRTATEVAVDPEVCNTIPVQVRAREFDAVLGNTAYQPVREWRDAWTAATTTPAALT